MGFLVYFFFFFFSFSLLRMQRFLNVHQQRIFLRIQFVTKWPKKIAEVMLILQITV